MNNKKAEFLLGEVAVKLIIALMCMIVLIWLAIYLYNLFIANPRIGQAKATINELAGRIDYLRSSKYEQIDYDFRSPAGWYLYFGNSQKDNKLNLCLCPQANMDSCSSGACVQKEKIVIGENLKNIPIAKKNAENLLLTKNKDDKIIIEITKNEK